MSTSSHNLRRSQLSAGSQTKTLICPKYMDIITNKPCANLFELWYSMYEVNCRTEAGYTICITPQSSSLAMQTSFRGAKLVTISSWLQRDWVQGKGLQLRGLSSLRPLRENEKATK